MDMLLQASAASHEIMPDWTTEVKDQNSLDALERSFIQGPIIDDSGRRSITEREVDRIGSLKIEVFSDEHPPPHFRVSYQGQSANFRISDCGKINGGLDRFRRNIRAWHAVHKDILIATLPTHRLSSGEIPRVRLALIIRLSFPRRAEGGRYANPSSKKVGKPLSRSGDL